MISNRILQKSNWFTKLSISFLSIVGTVNLFLYFVAPLLPFALSKFVLPFGLTLMGIAMLFSVLFSVYWHYKEKRGEFNSENCHIWLTSILRFWIALQISSFGFEKIMGVNFAPSFSANDTPAKFLNGQQLTWIYYSYSYGISLVVAFFQIVGSYLLLFRRTILLGISLLFPVMFNILLINIFYGIGPITTFMALLVVLGLGYLLFQRKEEIITLFKNFNPSLPSAGSKGFRNIVRLVCLLLPVLFLLQYKSDVYASSKYFGKWNVQDMIRDEKQIPLNTWEKDTTSWNTVYFEERGKVFFTPNPYKYDDDTSILMKYEYNKDKDVFRVISYERNPEAPDTIPVQIKKFTGDSMEWNMVLYNDTIQMHLKKENK